ncbi:MAG: HMG-box domain-containing protein, partial [bacterium]
GGGGGLSPSKPLVSQPPPIVSRPSSASPLINSGYKTPLQIFSGEVMAAAKRRLPNLDNAQLQKIVVDKWTKMTDREKQVYRAKSLAYAKLASGRVGEGGRVLPNAPALAARPPVVTSTVSTTGSPR